ncbi:putative integral membrane protein [Snodgrassella communis]|uniref:RDD family protein n=1 Tax=Snodgrassella communis TaxID=2946699 RepID=UPI0004611F6D|nr:RDD family protein [Snodgrassella communis]KDN13548.1 putative integral membrane protein [Snodgrassella communis]
MTDFHSSSSNSSLADDYEIEVELASPWSRIAAVIINVLIFHLGMILGTLFFGLIAKMLHSVLAGKICLILATLVPILMYFIGQSIMMSTKGQSFGKKLLGIKVIKIDGSNPGFIGTVLFRTVIPYVALLIVGLTLNLIFYQDIEITLIKPNLIALFFYIICLFMLFRTATYRRTLEDYLAKTIVIKI